LKAGFQAINNCAAFLSATQDAPPPPTLAHFNPQRTHTHKERESKRKYVCGGGGVESGKRDKREMVDVCVLVILPQK